MYLYKERIKKLTESLLKFKKIGVLSHVRADADCLGSQVALAIWLKRNGIEVIAHNDGPIPDNIVHLIDFFEVNDYSPKDIKSCDAFLFVDGNSLSRFGKHADLIEKSDKPLFMIDHHPDPDSVFEVMLSEPAASSTAELVYFLFDETHREWIDADIAEAIYTGVMTDTGSFRFDSVGPHTHEVAANLMRLTGINTSKIHEKVYDTYTLNQLKLISAVLNQVKIHKNSRVAYMWVTEQNLKESDTTYQEIEGLIDYALSLKDADAAIIFSERYNEVKMSFRSKTDFDVNLLARKFDGGGHQKASGGWHPGPLEKAIEEVLTEAEKMAGTFKA